jgi:hypothetical protein
MTRKADQSEGLSGYTDDQDDEIIDSALRVWLALLINMPIQRNPKLIERVKATIWRRKQQKQKASAAVLGRARE